MRLGPHSVVVLRAGAKASDYGNVAVLDWSSPTRTTVTGCSVQPPGGETGQYTIDRDSTETELTVFLPWETDVLADDRVEFDGAQYQIVGDVARWQFGALAHKVVYLQRSTDT
jgi:hypothetical protein